MKEVEKRRRQVAVAGIPKTIDNDIAVTFLAVICSELVLK
jgi:6-phosphofructokinase